jgi:hypothetical protein
MAKRPSLIPLPNVLTRVLKSHGMDARMREYALQQRWTEIVGPQVGHHTFPDSIRHHKLYLVVENSVWMQHLLYLKPDLLAKINTAAEGDPLTDIVFRVGSVPDQEADVSLPLQPFPPSGRGEIEVHMQAELDESVRPVADPNLRERLRELFAKSLVAAPKKP